MRLKKCIVTIILSILIMEIIPQIVLATSAGPGEIFSQAQAFQQMGQAGGEEKLSVDEIAVIVKPIATVLLAIGTVTVLVIVIIIGIKYMTATPDTKGKLKVQLIGLAVSVVVLYGAYGIWSLIYKIMSTTVG